MKQKESYKAGKVKLNDFLNDFVSAFEEKEDVKSREEAKY